MNAAVALHLGLPLAKAKSGEALKAGPIWFAVVLLLGIACYFLFKSMSKHLRIVREEFPADPPRRPAAAASQPAPAPAAQPDQAPSAEPPTTPS